MADLPVDPPQYATAPRFLWDLSLVPRMGIILDLMQNRCFNHRCSQRIAELDPSQQEAVVDNLTREVPLIQGPPSTTKVRPSDILSFCELILGVSRVIPRRIFSEF